MSEAERPAPRLVALVCPECGADLDGLAADRVFGCSPCARAWSLEPDGLRGVPLAAWEPDGPGERLYLPLWAMEVDATVVLPPRHRVSGLPGLPPADDRIVPFEEGLVYVTAFDLQGRGNFGDPGMHFTRRRPAVRLRPGAPPRLAGATVTRSAAAALVPTAILAVTDAREDVLGAKVDATIRSATLVLVPFARRDDGGVVEPFGGIGYPPAALPDLAAIAG